VVSVLGCDLLLSGHRGRSYQETAAKPINTVNSDKLQQVPGIGPVTAEKILQMRKSYGAFRSVDDLLAIKGFGKKRLEKMRKYLTVSKAPAGKQPSKSPPPPATETEAPPG
jgi:competence ComEA-like helix-hairpin-helix protein